MTKDYLAEYDAATDAAKYPLVHKWMNTDPLPFFRQLRQQRPILVTPDFTLLSRFTDVRDVLQMPSVFTVELYKPKMGVTEDSEGYLMAHDDDALHYREKSLMQGILNRDDIPRVRVMIQDSAKDILNRAGGQLEVINEYCRMVPALMVQNYFGLNGIDPEALLRWSFWSQYNTFHNQPFNLNSPEKAEEITKNQQKTSEELADYLTVLMVRKLLTVRLVDRPIDMLCAAVNRVRAIFKAAPIRRNDDIVKRMLRSRFAPNVDFTLPRIGINAGGLLIGAVETTSQAVAQVIQHLIETPKLLDQAQAASQLEDTSQLDAIVFEALRFVPISPYMFRKASRDYTIAKGTDRETTIPAGTIVLTLTQSAMFDTYAYENPDEFNPNRNFYHNFTFGFASHECLGKHVGMAMIPEMVRQVMLLDNLKAKSPIDYKDGPFPESYELCWGQSA